MPPRLPTKNRINMHDIVAQPLTALPDAVDAILRRPEVLDDVEVSSIFAECSYIFLRAEEALSMRNDEAFCALFKLLSEGFAHSEASFEAGINTFALHGPLLQTVHALFRVVVEQGAMDVHSSGTVELVQVISSLCDGEAIKDTCGSLFMKGLADLLARVYADGAEAQQHFHVQRGAATALINLVKGSKQNKLRLSSWKFVADCCAASVDVFFQLQCVELLFRVSRQKKSVLTQLGDALSPDHLEKLRSLPNDGTLLGRMTALVEDINAGRPEVLRYTLSQVVAAETVLTESTEAYFTPHHLIVMVTSANADNITIPYRIIRSVTLGKDGRVIIRLDVFPVKLEVLLSHTAGMDTVTLHMTQERLTQFKKSPIRSWIVAALTARREAARAAAATAAASAAAMTAPTVSTSGVKRSSEERAPSPEDEEAASKVSVSTTSLPVGGGDVWRKKQRLELDATAGGAATTLRAMIDEIATRATAKETHAIYAQLKRLIDAKIELHKGETVTALNATMGEIQGMVDTARRQAQDARSQWVARADAEVGRLEAQLDTTQNLAAAAVEGLNTDLRSIKQRNQALNEHVLNIEVELQRTLEESRETEAAQLRELRVHFDRELEAQEQELDQQLIHRANSGVVLSDYMRSAASRGSLL